MTDFLIFLRHGFPVSIWTMWRIPSPSCSIGHYKNCTATFTFQSCNLRKKHRIFNLFLSTNQSLKKQPRCLFQQSTSFNISLHILKKQEEYSIHVAFLQNSLASQHCKKRKSPSNQILVSCACCSLCLYHPR